ncbi:THOC6 family protein [Megaselia abdita]
MMESKLKKLYNNVVSQAISTSGKFLFAGNVFSDIFVFEINEILNSLDEPQQPKIYPQNAGLISSLEFHNDFLIVGGKGSIYGLKFNESTNELSKDKSWEVFLAEGKSVNYFWLNKADNDLFAGCDNNIIYQVSLEDGRVVRKFEGHKDFIHCLTGSDDQIYSASQDGTLKIWDPRENGFIHEIEPQKKHELKRPEFGGFLGSCAISNDWLICGGGPKLSLWNTKTLEYSPIDFGFPGKIHCSYFIDDNIVIGGTHPSVQIYSINGDLKYDLPVENSPAIYSIVFQTEPQKIMTLAGYSNQLNVLSDFRYVDIILDLYK